jgi:hypothetical protein
MTDVGQAGPGVCLADAPPPATRAARRLSLRPRRLDPVELAIVAAFAVLSLWVLGLTLWEVVVHGRIWTGTDGIFVTDQMGYLAWIRDASQHVLASDLFRLHRTPADLLQPLVAVAGGLVALGLSPWAALLLFKPLAVAALLGSAAAFVHRTIDGAAARRVALGLGLFFVGPGGFVAQYAVPADPASRLRWSALSLDASLGFWSWGYTFGLIALSCALLAVLSYGRARVSGERLWLPGILGALASWFHPWQGATMILVLLAGEILSGRRSRTRGNADAARPGTPIALPLATLLLTALPLLYFAILDRADPSWNLARSPAQTTYPLWMVAVTVAPLAIPALLAYRIRPGGFPALAARMWPPAALVVFLASETKLGAIPTHALLGLAIPLAVLAVEGIRSLAPRRPVTALAAILVAILTLPAIWWELSTARNAVRASPAQSQATGARFLARGERDALDYLRRDRAPGGVLTGSYLGPIVPALTGRHTWVGNFYYPPDYAQRVASAGRLFSGRLAPAAARALVRASGARYVLVDCESAASGVAAELAPLLARARRFGCARVLVLQ